jgi:phage shock protein C
MYCTHCGHQLQQLDRYCASCGQLTPNGPEASFRRSSATGYDTPKKLIRPRDRAIAGVCSGIANYAAVDVVLVRLLWIGLVILGGTGLLAYTLCWIVIPNEQLTFTPQQNPVT